MLLTAGEYQDGRLARRSTASSLAEALPAKATRTSFDVLDRVSAPSNLTPPAEFKLRGRQVFVSEDDRGHAEKK